MSIHLFHGAYIADTARVLGEVELGRDVSIWYGVAMRGDVAKIIIGPSTNVQDNTVIHCDKGYPNIIGSNVSIGHGAICHGESIGDGTLIGMGARLLGHTRIGKGCIIGAGAVVPPGMVVPDGMVVLGLPGKVIRPTNDQEKEYLQTIPPRYVEMARLHYEHPDDPRVRPLA